MTTRQTMSARHRKLVVFVLTLSLGHPALLPAAEPFTCFIGTSQRAGEGGAFSALVGGALLCRPPSYRPVAWFSAQQRPGEKAKYLYLLLFKTPANFDSRGAAFSSDGAATPHCQHARMSAILAGKKIEIAYRFETDPQTHILTTQTLTFNDKPIAENSRLLVVDLTQDPPAIQPLNVPLPEEVPDLASDNHDLWGATLVKVVNQLQEQSPEVKKRLEEQK